MTGYVFQDDILMGTLTVRECLMFSAELRLPSCVTYQEKVERVENAMKDLGITHIAERIIGTESSRGISGGEKRRVSIGVELVISPHVLFLDEPTSGLDAYNAYSVVKCLVGLAKKGRTIIFSIHQPRSNIFSQFDDIILMNGGSIAYAGSADDSVKYFKNLGYQFPENTNPADYLIDILTLQQENVNIVEEFKIHEKKVNRESEQYENQKIFQTVGKPKTDDEFISLLSKPSHLKMPFATSFLSQFFILSKRTFFNFIRNFYLMPAHFGGSIVLGFLLGGIYWNLGINLAASQNRVGVIFFMCSVLAFSAMSSLELFVSERTLYTREKANGYYRPMAYFFSKIVFDIIPLRVVPPLIIGSISYYMIGLRSNLNHFFWFLLILVLFNVVAGSLCLVIASIAPS
jgi:ABC-type multidrug transport system ATPase subunit